MPSHVRHPGNVYLREADILPAIDRWLAVIFAPHRLTQTIAELATAQALPATPGPAEPAQDTQAAIADCDARLARYLAALDAGGNPQAIAVWTRQRQSRTRRCSRPRRHPEPPSACPSARWSGTGGAAASRRRLGLGGRSAAALGCFVASSSATCARCAASDLRYVLIDPETSQAPGTGGLARGGHTGIRPWAAGGKQPGPCWSTCGIPGHRAGSAE